MTKRDEWSGKWRVLYSEGLYNWHSVISIVRSVESIGVQWIGYVT